MEGEKMAETADKVSGLHDAWQKVMEAAFSFLEGIFLALSHDFFLDWALDSKQLEWSVRRDIFSINTNQLLLGMIKAIGHMTYELQIKSGLISL